MKNIRQIKFVSLLFTMLIFLLLQSSLFGQKASNVEFWETFKNKEIYPFLEKANKIISEIETSKNSTDTTAKPTLLTQLSLVDQLKIDSSKNDTSQTPEQFKQNNPLFAILYPNVDNERKLADNAVVGLSHYKDTSTVNKYLALKQVKSLFPSNLKFLWTYKPIKESNVFQLIAIRVTNPDGKAPLDRAAIKSANVEIENSNIKAEISIFMNPDGLNKWASLTRNNIGKQIAIVIDNQVYSFSTIQKENMNGKTYIVGDFTKIEANEISKKINYSKSNLNNEGDKFLGTWINGNNRKLVITKSKNSSYDYEIKCTEDNSKDVKHYSNGSSVSGAITVSYFRANYENGILKSDEFGTDISLLNKKLIYIGKEYIKEN